MNHKRNQIIAITAVVVLMGLLFTQPIKGLVNENEETDSSAEAGTLVTFQSESQRAKQGLNPSIIQDITDLEASLATAGTDAERTIILTQLAEQWDGVDKPSPLGFAYEEMARLSNDPGHWLK